MMTKDGSMTHDAERDRNAYERFRAELLISGLSDWVSLAEIQQIISHFELADTDSERQDLDLRTIRSLLKDASCRSASCPGRTERSPRGSRSTSPWTVSVSASSAATPSRHRGTTRYGWV